jgi:uncharacterized protein YyaL (SSP411 family)
VLAGEPGRADFERLRDAAFDAPVFNRVLAHADAKESLADLVPLTASRRSADGSARAFVCRNFACGLPTADPAELTASLDA